MINTIIDIYHGNNIDLETAFGGGIVAIIHKATQGPGNRDSKYHERRQAARELGFLWGAYHFSSGHPVTDQVENFLSYAKPEDDDLISLDWEHSTDGSPDMTLAQARTFVQMIKDETGRWPVVYGGDLLREQIGNQVDAILLNCPLWYVRYSATPKGIPTQVWETYTLWQYTDGEGGPEPHNTPGVTGADRNVFEGTAEELKAQWPFTRRDEAT
jgi:lysozyme